MAIRYNWWYRRKRYSSGVAPDGFPIPPTRLVLQVAGTPDIGWFLEGGQLAAQSLIDVLARGGLKMGDFPAILDLGCGCGRVIRHLSTLPSSTRLYGTDYNSELISWCCRHLKFAEFGVNQLNPPLPYATGSFGLVYALSVFTHLPEHLQIPWTEEIKRVLQPGGYLILTLHGDHYFESLAPKEQEIYKANRLVVRDITVAGTNLCAAFHPRTYVKSHMAEGYDLVEFVAEGARGNPYQDLYLLRKRK